MTSVILADFGPHRVHDVWVTDATHDGLRVVGPSVDIRLLGVPRGVIVAGGSVTNLSARRSELLALLAVHPEGCSSQQLAQELYGDDGNAVTVRAELSRVRRLLGPSFESRPYRLAPEFHVDLVDVVRLLRMGAVHRALALYGGPLLPLSRAPAIEEVRDEVDAAVRQSVIVSGDPGLLVEWLTTPSGADDAEACALALDLLDADDPRRGIVLTRARVLRRRYRLARRG